MNVFKRTFGFINQHPLAKNHLLNAYFKFIVWQVKSRFNHNLQPINFIGGTRFLAKKGLNGVTGNIYAGLHEFNDMGFLLHFLRKEDIFYDIGANVGSYTILAAGVCQAKTLSFEPVTATFSILKQNIDLNNLLDLVILNNSGIGSQEGNLYFTEDQDTMNHIILEKDRDESAILVKVNTVDHFYASYKPSLIKIDVEGFETEVINGADKTLSDSTLKAIIIELNGSGERFSYDEDKIREKLVSHGFKPFEYDPFTRHIAPISSYGNYNTVYLRDIDFVAKRLSSAPTFNVFNQKI